MSILLIRHGETAQNHRRIVQRPEDPLSERGRAQADAVAARVAALGVGAIMASDYARAHGTAEAIRTATGAPLEIDPLLRERHFGEIRGTPYEDLEIDIFAPGYRPPGGEDLPTFAARVARAWANVQKRAENLDGNLVVVTHGLVLGALCDGPLDCERPDVWGNTALTRIGKTAPYRVELLGCTAHLADIGGAPDPTRGRV